MMATVEKAVPTNSADARRASENPSIDQSEYKTGGKPQLSHGFVARMMAPYIWSVSR
jgi:hypothetical protein